MIDTKRCYLGLVLGWLYLPMGVLIAYSFNEHPYGLNWQQWGLHWFESLAGDSDLIEATGHSIAVALSAATLATVVGTLGAVGLRWYRFRGQSLAHRLLWLSLMLPDIVMGVALLVWFIILKVRLGYLSLLVAHTTFCLPFVAVTVLSRLQNFDRGLIEAARDLGASEAQALMRVVLPLAGPAITAGWLLSLTLSLDDVVVSFLVAGPDFEVLPLRIYSMVRMGVRPEVNALAALLFLLSLSLVVTAQRLLSRRT